jgi:hypothetical protein
MFIKSSILALALASSTFARELIIERDGRPFYPRRFGQEQCGGIGGQIGSACNGAVCGVLGGRVPGTLLAGADPCAQQDLADDIINASKDQDAATATVMVQVQSHRFTFFSPYSPCLLARHPVQTMRKEHSTRLFHESPRAEE